MVDYSLKYISENQSNHLFFHLIAQPDVLVLPWRTTNYASNWLRSILGNRSDQSRIFNMGDVYSDLLLKDKVSEAKELLVEFLKGVCINNFMYITRRMWAPPSGEGSQDDALAEHRLLASITLDIAERLEHRWDEDG